MTHLRTWSDDQTVYGYVGYGEPTSVVAGVVFDELHVSWLCSENALDDGGSMTWRC